MRAWLPIYIMILLKRGSYEFDELELEFEFEFRRYIKWNNFDYSMTTLMNR